MKFKIVNVLLLSLAIALMAIATDLPDDPASATSTVTVTESVCMNGCAGDATPLSMANAMATAPDASVAAVLIANMMHNDPRGGAATPQLAANTTTVTTLANATGCPAPPTFDMNLFSSFLDGELNNMAPNDTDAIDTKNSDQRWSKGRYSLCLTTSSWVSTGSYAIYLDGWGRDPDRCGKGALDNLHGQCGNVERWECKFWGTNGVLLTFNLPGAWRAKCALDAMWLASPKDKREEGLCCVYMGDPHIAMNTC